MPAGPPGADHTHGHETGIAARLTGQANGRTGSPSRGGRDGLLFLVLIVPYLLSAFSGAKLVTEFQVVLFAGVLLIALRTSLLPRPWPGVIAAITVLGTAVVFWTSLSGARVGKASEDFWKALLLLMAVVMVV